MDDHCHLGRPRLAWSDGLSNSPAFVPEQLVQRQPKVKYLLKICKTVQRFAHKPRNRKSNNDISRLRFRDDYLWLASPASTF